MKNLDSSISLFFFSIARNFFLLPVSIFTPNIELTQTFKTTTGFGGVKRE